MTPHLPTVAEMLRRARESAGFDDFGPEPFEEALGVLLAALQEEGNLTDVAMVAEIEEAHKLLVTRLRTEAMLARHPEILEEKIDAPVIIIGPQRSGTSKLFRVIAADPQWNYLPTWQAIDPVPPDMERPQVPGEDERIGESDRWVGSMANRQAGHTFETRAPEMEVLLMRDSFMITSGKRLVLAHQKYVETADHAPVYRRLRKQLQLVQWQNHGSGKRWILKAPPHLIGLRALAAEFPDATLVMTHRHPAQCIASMCRLTELAQQGTAREIDRRKIGECWSRVIEVGLGNFLAFEDGGQGDRVVHVSYRQVEQDVLPAIEAIYARAGAPVTDATRAAVAAWEAANPRHKQGGFSYRLEDYGLSMAQVERRCGRWLARHGHRIEA